MKKLEFFKNRYTVRHYQPREIDIDTVKSMLEAATHAPNTGNMQWYSVVITRDPAAKARLAPAHFDQPSVSGASAVLTFCLDLRRFEHWCRLNRAEPGFDNFQSFIAAMIDTTIFAQQFCTIAEMSGYGTCYLGTTTYNAPDIVEALSLPDRVVPVTTVTLGYPLMPGKPMWRIDADALIHEEKYRDLTDDEIRRYYSPIEKEEVSVAFVEHNGKETLAQVFTDVRYPRESAEYFSKVYAELLKRNRFILKNS